MRLEAQSKAIPMIKLDELNCINLIDGLQVVSFISQEQAWALCFELASLMKQLKTRATPIESLAQIRIHREGFVHRSSVYNPNKTSKSATTTIREANSIDKRQDDNETDQLEDKTAEEFEGELVASLGIALFWALDFGVADDEERNLDLTMEYLIVQSQSSDHKPTLDQILDLCRRRLTCPAEDQGQFGGTGAAETIKLAFNHHHSDSSSNTQHQERAEFHNSKDHADCTQIKTTNTARASNRDESSSSSSSENSERQATHRDQTEHQMDQLAEQHYRRICKTFLDDAIELSLFLEKIYTASMVLSDISSHPNGAGCLEQNEPLGDLEPLEAHAARLASFRALGIKDWARLWMQVIRELRQRADFKKQTPTSNQSQALALSN